MKLIIGLGNPGIEYSKTRHNIGFMCVDNYVNNFLFDKRFNANISETRVDLEKVIFVKPMTYMNESGFSVRKIMDYYNIGVDDILVIHDDLDLNIGNYKIKKNSSSGGHNGIKSIIKEIGSDSFSRLKIGISNNKNIPTKDYVLGKFSNEEMEILNKIISLSKEIINSFISDGLDKTMNKYNTK